MLASQVLRQILMRSRTAPVVRLRHSQLNENVCRSRDALEKLFWSYRFAATAHLTLGRSRLVEAPLASVTLAQMLE
jgi:hypothetical protein